LGVYGTSAITAVTSQKTLTVGDIFAMPPQTGRAQIDAGVQDIHLSAVKTGLLATPHLVRPVAGAIEHLAPPHLVVDPVLAATAAGPRALLSADALSVLKTRLLPLAAVVTPNSEEAATLTGRPVTSVAQARDAARKLADFGALAVVVKGGHLPGA